MSQQKEAVMEPKIPLTPETVQQYLDGLIRGLRSSQKGYAMDGHIPGLTSVGRQIDVVQKIREDLIGERLTE